MEMCFDKIVVMERKRMKEMLDELIESSPAKLRVEAPLSPLAHFPLILVEKQNAQYDYFIKM